MNDVVVNNGVAIWVGLLQGISEMLPISSFGQGVIIPYLVKGIWTDKVINLATDGYFQLIVITHLATTLVLFYQYRANWFMYMRKFIREKGRKRYDTMLFKIVLASIPVMALGFLLNRYIEHHFSTNYRAISLLLVLNGVIFLIVEGKKKSRGKGEVNNRNFTHKIATKIGLYQAAALLPGLSRLGLVMVGSRAQNYSYTSSCYIAYILSLPVIFAATVFKIFELNHFNPALITGFFTSLVSSYIAINIMTRFSRISASLVPFALFTITEGIFTFFYTFFAH